MSNVVDPVSADTNKPKLMTAEQFRVCETLPEYCELVKGKVIEMNRPSPRHGEICAEIARLIGNFCKEHNCGRAVSNDSGIIVFRSPDTVRGPDIAFYSFARVPKGPLPDEYFDTAPNVVFEVLSKSDRWATTLVKIGEYLGAQIDVVCVVDPEQQTARLFRNDKSDITYTEDESLTIPEIHEAFAIRVGDIFA